MKNFLSSFGKKIVVASLIGSSVVAGGIVAGYYLFFNNNKEEETKKINYVYREKSIFGQNSPKFYQAALEDTKDYWLNEDEENKLIEKIKNELGYGPEFDKLRSITIGDENMTGEDANGVYYPTLNKIYINLENFQKYINFLKNKKIGNTKYDDDILSKIKINLIFETIFHEYGHHIGFSYLTNEGNFDHSQVDESIYSNGKLSNWNKNFTKDFKEYLNYSGWEGKKYTHAKQTYQINKQENITYRSIGSIYSQEDLFNHANAKQEYDFHEMDNPDKIPYLFAGLSGFIVGFPQKIPKDQLSYYYSMDELFTRKYQQLNQLYKPVADEEWLTRGYFAYDSNINPGALNIVTKSDLLNNTLLYQNGFGSVVMKNKKYKLINFKDYNISNPIYNLNWNKNPNFNNSTISNRFLYDAPFNNDKYKYTKEDGNQYNLKDHSKDLYDLMDRFLGHASGADISIVWPENNLEIKNTNSKKMYLTTENVRKAKENFKFGGYIKDKNYDSIGYEENGKYHELSKITIKDFTYKHKSWLGATNHEPLDVNDENYFYTTDDFINKNSLQGKNLFFKKKNVTLYEPLKSVRANVDTGTNSTWYTYFSDQLKIKQRYSFVLENGKVIFKEMPSWIKPN